MIRLLRFTPILQAALLVGFCANLLFYGKPLGLSLLLFVVLFVTVLFYIGRRSAVDPVRHNLWILAPLLFFAAMVAIRDNTFLTTLNVLAVAGLLTYLILYYAAGRIGDSGLMPAMLIPLYTAGKSLLAAPSIIKEGIVAPRLLQHSRDNLLSIAKGALLAAPLLFVFTILLALADTMFANSIVRLINPAHIRHLFSLNFQALFILGIAWMVTGGLALAVDNKDHAADLNGRFATFRRFRLLGFTESTTVLTLVNLLFLSFVIVQFRYLFSGEANIHIDGYTYAEYARRGFFELLIVAILSLGLVLGIEAITWRESKQQFRLFNLQSGLLIGLVIIMIVSAFRRMRLYEATYGYTELRLYVYLFMIWLAFFLIWFLIGLFRRPDRFALGAMLLVIGFLVALNLINPDAFIVRQNISRYWAGGDLDVPYLNSLSADAIPALIKAATAGGGAQGNFPCQIKSDGDIRKVCDTNMAQILQTNLQKRYRGTLDDPGSSPWQSINLARWRARYLLANRFP
jgi:hypothetical protein